MSIVAVSVYTEAMFIKPGVNINEICMRASSSFSKIVSRKYVNFRYCIMISLRCCTGDH